jgi:hypothetical protein
MAGWAVLARCNSPWRAFSALPRLVPSGRPGVLGFFGRLRVFVFRHTIHTYFPVAMVCYSRSSFRQPLILPLLPFLFAEVIRPTPVTLGLSFIETRSTRSILSFSGSIDGYVRNKRTSESFKISSGPATHALLPLRFVSLISSAHLDL